jgi:uncharacterized protein
MQVLIHEFLEQKRFAVVGATDNSKKLSNPMFQTLKKRGYEVYPVNPDFNELEGVKCFSSLADIPVKVDVVYFCVPPTLTEKILKQCLELGLNRIWLEPGSESETAIAFCRKNNLNVIHNIGVILSEERLNNEIVLILKPSKSLENN